MSAIGLICERSDRRGISIEFRIPHERYPRSSAGSATIRLVSPDARAGGKGRPLGRRPQEAPEVLGRGHASAGALEQGARREARAGMSEGAGAAVGRKWPRAARCSLRKYMHPGRAPPVLRTVRVGRGARGSRGAVSRSAGRAQLSGSRTAFHIRPVGAPAADVRLRPIADIPILRNDLILAIRCICSDRASSLLQPRQRRFAADAQPRESQRFVERLVGGDLNIRPHARTLPALIGVRVERAADRVKYLLALLSLSPKGARIRHLTDISVYM